MSSYSESKNSYINSVIGEGSFFKGNISINGLLRVDGDLQGDIKTDGKVLIGKHGRAESNIQAGTVVIGGAVKGNINATDRIVILSSAILLGNIKAPRLEIEEGVLINGKCTICNNKLSEDDAIPTQKQLNNADNIDKYNPAYQKAHG